MFIKKITYLALIGILNVNTLSHAKPTEIKISKETLRTYKEIQKEIKTLKENMKMYYTLAFLQANMSVKRFKELQKHKENVEKLRELGCTTQEMEAVHMIERRQEMLGLQFKKQYQNLIKNKIDISLYNTITERLKQDPSLLDNL